MLQCDLLSTLFALLLSVIDIVRFVIIDYDFTNIFPFCYNVLRSSYDCQSLGLFEMNFIQRDKTHHLATFNLLPNKALFIHMYMFAEQIF